MPSVNSSSRPNVWPSSTFTTPSLPTFSIASAITSPMAFSIPRLSAIGFAPAETFFRPSRTIAWARTVAVVVPSPATSFVAVATSRTSCAPWFSKTSSTSISRAIVTPSFVIVGAPNFLSRTTYRPFGPRVTLTASARMSTPRWSERRASSLNLSSLCAMDLLSLPLGLRAGQLAVADDLREHVALAQDQVVGALDLDLGAAVLGEDDDVALLDLHRDDLPGLAAPLAGPRGDDVAALRPLERRVGEDDAGGGRLLLLDRLDDQPVAKLFQVHRLDLHW